MIPLEVELSHHVQPFPGERESGDGVVVVQQPPLTVMALIDGLGHGPKAAAVARLGGTTLEEAGPLPVNLLLHRCHMALQDTRGAAMAIAHLDAEQHLLTFGGVGNVEARLFVRATQDVERFVSYNGIVGATLPTIRLFQYAVAPGDLLVLHSDGISSSWKSQHYLMSPTSSPRLIAAAISRAFARTTDDWSILVARFTERTIESTTAHG